MIQYRQHAIHIFLSLWSILFIFYSNDCHAQTKENITAGVYIEDVHNIDYSKSTFDIIFFLWVNSDVEMYDLQKYVDINGATDIDYSLESQDTLKGKVYHSEARIKAKMLNNFDVNNFPFDNIRLNLEIEFVKNDATHLILNPDVEESEINPEYIGSDSLRIETTFSKGLSKYTTNFGNKDLGTNVVYPKLHISLNMARDSWNVFIKLFITLFIALFLSAGSILLPLKMSEEKFGLIVGSLFTAIGNKYITDDLLPMSGNFNLSDRIHLLTFLFITFIAFFAILEQRQKLMLSKKKNFMLFVGVVCCYGLFVVFATIV